MDKFKSLIGYNSDWSVKADRNKERDRWSNNSTFIVAAVGCAIGLGNLWRFPYLCFKHGGGAFFIPYLLCLFGLGIPMILLEFTLGQVMQKGNVYVWNALHPRLYGLGFATCFACYLIVIYYNVLISWALTLFFNSFYNPLPWSTQRTTDDAGLHKECKDMFITEEFFYKDVLGIYNDDCTSYKPTDSMGEGSFFQWQIFLSSMLTWIICFACVFQGVKISSYVVWFTVPMPVVFVFIMVMNGFTLKNCDEGFRMYLKGYVNDEAVDVNEKLASGEMWTEAAAQIFFTLSICWGVMVSYASYLPPKAPVIKNGFAVALINCSFSFFAGFAVFAVVGYVKGMGLGIATKTSSIGLAFITFPAAIDTMPGANFWALLFSITLFLLGIDSAFAMVEGTVIVIQDSALGKKLSKFATASILCLLGALCSIVFCFNWGFYLFDTIDHYLNVFLIMSMAILQSIGAAWVHGQDDAMKTCKISSIVLIVGYYGLLLPLAWLQFFAFGDQSVVAIPIFWAWFVIVAIVSCLVGKFGPNKLSVGTWYQEIFFSGARPICHHMLIRNESKWHRYFERIFEAWWCFSIKFIFPWAMYTLLVLTIADDIENKGYGGLYVGYQVLGAIVPIVGIILFLIPLIFNKTAPSGEFKKTFAIGAELNSSSKVEPEVAASDEPKVVELEANTNQ